MHRSFAGIRRAALLGMLLAGITLIPLARAALAQQSTGSMPAMTGGTMPGQDQMPGMVQQGTSMMSMPGQPTAARLPTLPGQDAFGAIQEIVHILEADPNTDWSKVNLEALRQHLIDMNEVTLRAAVLPQQIDRGLQMTVTGQGRTIPAIKRMVSDDAREIERSHLNGWTAKTDPLPDGVLFTVTSTDPSQVERIRGLGFIGILASGSHHQLHHLSIARGEIAYMQ